MCKAAFQQMSLKFTAEEMKNTRSLRKAAAAQKRGALRAAPEEMKGDRELCTAAVAQDWKAFHFVSEEMQGKPQAMHGSGCPGLGSLAEKSVNQCPASLRRLEIVMECQLCLDCLQIQILLYVGLRKKIVRREVWSPRDFKLVCAITLIITFLPT